MKTIIFCGGQGTRLREETEYRPKPLVDIGGHPILWHIMKLYGHYGFSDFVLCLGYRGHMLKEYFLNYEAMNNDFTIRMGGQQRIHYHDSHKEQDYCVTLADTGLNTMTGGRLLRIKRFIEDDTFLVTYGDGVADVDLRALLDFHQAHGKVATITTVQPPSRFGILDIGKDKHVDRFREKPQQESWASAGFFVFNRRIFDYLWGDDCALEQHPLQQLAAEGELVAYCHEGFFYAMDTYREYLLLNEMWNSGKAPWKVWSQ